MIQMVSHKNGKVVKQKPADNRNCNREEKPVNAALALFRVRPGSPVNADALCSIVTRRQAGHVKLNAPLSIGRR